MSYNLSDSYKDDILGKIEDYGTKNNRVADVMNLDMKESGVQRAVDYYSQKVRGYNDISFKYDAISNGSTRGELLPDRSGIKIYDAALEVNGQKDATSLMATIDHEHNHFQFNDKWIAEAKRHNFNDFSQRMIDGKIYRGSGAAFVEASNYNLGVSQGSQFNYSKNVIKYLETERDGNLTWQSKIIIQGF
ncbi:MAG: hypothetical protein HUK21_11935 [Fibrobacteraceae bacterium]|nr:hypothetical protein [Fibrobacteraceae bacterium]